MFIMESSLSEIKLNLFKKKDDNANKIICGFDHKFCNKHISNRLKDGFKNIGGIATIIVSSDNCVLLGKQRGGNHKNKYSIVHGKMDDVDKNCYKQGAIREIEEEFKIKLDQKKFNEFFITKTGNVRYITLQGTVIFVAIIEKESIDLNEINKEIEICLQDTREETWSLREVEDVRWVPLSQIPQYKKISGGAIEISDFAKLVIQEYNNKCKDMLIMK